VVNKQQWHKWFAWYPVKAQDDRYYWLVTMWRKWEPFYNYYIDDYGKIYSTGDWTYLSIKDFL